MIGTLVLLQTLIILMLGRCTLRIPNGLSKANTLNLNHIHNVLVVRLDEIGDIVMFSPFLRELRDNLPNAQITLVVKPGVHNLVEKCPYVDQIVVFDPSGTRWKRPFVLPWRTWHMSARMLHKEKYDLAIVPKWGTDSVYATYLAFFSGAMRRSGYSERVEKRKSILNRGFDRLLTHPLLDYTIRHEVDHNLNLLRFLGFEINADHTEVWFDKTDLDYARQVLLENRIAQDTTVIALGPSGGHSLLKQWPIENFVELGKNLTKSDNVRLLVFGGSGEEYLGDAIAGAIGDRVISQVGKTTLRQMAALLSLCHLYIGNDTGITHIAAALNIPVIAIFGSTHVQRFAPRGTQVQLLWAAQPCSPMYQPDNPDRCKHCIYEKPRCLHDITVDDAMTLIRPHLQMLATVVLD